MPHASHDLDELGSIAGPEEECSEDADSQGHPPYGRADHHDYAHDDLPCGNLRQAESEHRLNRRRDGEDRQDDLEGDSWAEHQQRDQPERGEAEERVQEHDRLRFFRVRADGTDADRQHGEQQIPEDKADGPEEDEVRRNMELGDEIPERRSGGAEQKRRGHEPDQNLQKPRGAEPQYLPDEGCRTGTEESSTSIRRLSFSSPRPWSR